ncbi:hypothetical protein QN382_19240 [Pseudomonas sp. 10B1]|uniref:hypothetical protein n=1 Tax=unclassified Pseudomonas TaxID=196821 RepID=UPI002AB4A42C|nr:MULTISPECIES: hypothetical protein [unclassified Pseudomonas]MDY7561439.1 hypothetical protein [Pseudomonas sp. AB6]MEA9976782.1 hypothetical protein [Pseudomonas sp. RTS4]MEA9994880.1 hypothetical protein [Pseudomonas sp. AA4]MEB0088701.1 hypothetical protein [Pseudomonas sp. RTI1]MEB0127174.1 hypothetical protein [Pseudomonas sp. CCC1.2]
MALGLTGRYLGGQAAQQWQRFDARGGDPDQFAGWFCQVIRAANTLPVIEEGSVSSSRLETIEVVDPFVQQYFHVLNAFAEGFVRPELTFSLVLTARILTDRFN